jgi:long-chain acyl-CoA synthetase
LPEKTKEVMDDDGWFHTGDIGVIDSDGFLKITDRKKEIFKTSGGKYVAPQVMENAFKASRFIEQIIVVGENQKFPAALIVPNFEFCQTWAKGKGIDIGSNSEVMSKSPELLDRIKQDVAHFNEDFGNWEQIKKIHLLPMEMSIESGELTPTLKPKRKVIDEKYKSIIEGLYS